MRALQLGASDEPFALVGVIRTEGPTAVKTGNKSIIKADGRIEGWVGGHCTEHEIVKNALESIKEGSVRTMKLSTCHGGTMEVLIEPYLPRRKLIIFGHVPIVPASVRIAKVLGFNVVVVDKEASHESLPEADSVVRPDELEGIHVNSWSYIVIATMGELDQDYALRFIKSETPYIGIVAGKRRASDILQFLRAQGVTEEYISKVKSPAGIYLKAVTAEEIAVSIIAEIVELSRTQTHDLREYMHRASKNAGSRPAKREHGSAPQRASDRAREPIALDPVCGMTVDPSVAEYSSNVDGRTIVFCSEACKERFDLDPSNYLPKLKSAQGR